MQTTRMFWVAGFAALCVGAVPAGADLWLRFQVDETVATCPAAAQTATNVEAAHCLPTGKKKRPENY